MAADLDELDGIAQTVGSKREFNNKNLPGVEDGKHVFQILLAEFKEIASGAMFKFKLGVMNSTELIEGEKVFFFKTGDTEKNRKKINDLKADLAVLGCNPDAWTPFTKELKRVGSALIGVKFNGVKKTNGEFVNVYLNDRCKDDGLPEAIDAAVIEKANEADKFF